MTVRGILSKKITYVLFVSACLVLLGYFVSHTSSSKNDQINLSFSKDSSFDETKLVNESDAIVVGNISEMKDKITKKISSLTKEGKSVEVQVPYKVYDFTVLEDLKKNTGTPKTIQVVVPDVNVDGSAIDFKKNEKYALFLYKFDNFSSNAYAIIDFEEGILESDGKDGFKSKSKDSATMNLEQIKQFVHKYQKQ
ncbi:hypothetical protein [Paenibacillus cymbidii]|uniref:hypothetical protein n=1 Tax=Paenibacillus cymbidii TaxID=1639034 RepID=UPI001080AB73|nr:hypothetical protein [Paenibacillus cymbidii]